MTGGLAFACDRCRAGKRKCDAKKPACSLCQQQNRQCVYTESAPRKRKYWDEEYVRGLEAQVQSLLAVVEAQGEKLQTLSPEPLREPLLPHAPPKEPIPLPTSSSTMPEVSDERSPQAVDELQRIRYTLDSAHRSSSTPTPSVPATIAAHCQNMRLLREMVVLFLENINFDHQFTHYTSTDFLTDYPHQGLDDTLLHSAIIAVGATFSSQPNAPSLGDDFAEFAETLVFSCFRHRPSIKVVRALTMLSWRSLAPGRDHMGWIFISLAGGMCIHLRLHVLALDECDSRRLAADEEDIRTFWMFYIIDRSAISILGRNCYLPWRRINVLSFERTFAARSATLTEVAFASQCHLWYLHDQYMDKIFSSAFDTLPVSSQVHTLVSCQNAMQEFYKSVDSRLQLCGHTTHRAVLLFHLAYEMTTLISMPPFLRVFARMRTSPEKQSGSSEQQPLDLMLPVLRSLTTAAVRTLRLVRDYERGPGFLIPPNPVIIHHLLIAGIVHLMNATSRAPSVAKHSKYFIIRECLRLLELLRPPWPTRSEKSIKVIRVLAQRWGVTSCLPINMSHHLSSDARDVRSNGMPDDQGQFSVQSGESESAEASTAWPDQLEQLEMDSILPGLDYQNISDPGNQIFGDIFLDINDLRWGYSL